MMPRVAADTNDSLIEPSFSSSEPLSVVTICADEDTARSVRFFAESTPLLRLRLHRNEYHNDDAGSLREYMGDPLPDICLVDFDRDRRKAAFVAEQIHSTAPEVAVFAVSCQRQPERIIEAMHSGCSEYLIKPLDREQMLNAVARLAARKREKKQTYTGQVFALMGSKGGCGVTTLATQLGALLASSRKKTLLFDLHPDLGDAALYLGLTKTDYHFFELLENTDRLDSDFLQSFLVHHSSGLDLIPAPERRDNPRQIPGGAVTQALDFFRHRFEFVLADLPPSFSDGALEVIQNCDQVYIVTVAEVAAVRNLVRQMDYFTRKDVPAEKIRIVVNRHQKRSLVSDEQIEKVAGQKIYWRVPNQYPEVVKTIHEGNPVAQVSSSEVSRNVKDWAGTLMKRPDEESKKQNGKFLGFWAR